ncbi:hypothetical protein D3874_06950 [Oleomonas cavernae]|uniref:Uncharacterized protein n=1 Tax=Oleomonas cavernae TaxID=2320859 RepID=A0A418W9X4_9PROT|nr:hypothetical protein D3874_06950 [Oleomonas cavernae]
MPTPTTDKLRRIFGRYLDNETTLPPQEMVEAALAEVDEARKVCHPKYALVAATHLLAAYPQRGPENVKGYLAALAEEFERYPSRVVYDTVHEIRRTVKFPPSIAEVVEVADRLSARRLTDWYELRKIRDAINAQADRERQRLLAEAQERDRIRDLQRQLVEALGEKAPTLEEVETCKAFVYHSRHIGFSQALDLVRNLEALEPWAALACRRAAVFARLVALEGVTDAQRLAVIHLSERDLPAAVVAVRSGALDHLPPGLGTEDGTKPANWGQAMAYAVSSEACGGAAGGVGPDAGAGEFARPGR